MTSVMVASLPMIEMGWGNKLSCIEIAENAGYIQVFGDPAIPSASRQMGERKTG